jgi:hypothetical protein
MNRLDFLTICKLFGYKNTNDSHIVVDVSDNMKIYLSKHSDIIVFHYLLENKCLIEEVINMSYFVDSYDMICDRFNKQIIEVGSYFEFRDNFINLLREKVEDISIMFEYPNEVIIDIENIRINILCIENGIKFDLYVDGNFIYFYFLEFSTIFNEKELCNFIIDMIYTLKVKDYDERNTQKS